MNTYDRRGSRSKPEGSDKHSESHGGELLQLGQNLGEVAKDELTFKNSEKERFSCVTKYGAYLAFTSNNVIQAIDFMFS
jgi:hypothetical protein